MLPEIDLRLFEIQNTAQSSFMLKTEPAYVIKQLFAKIRFFVDFEKKQVKILQLL